MYSKGLNIKLYSVDAVKEFVEINRRFSGTVKVLQNRFEINGISLMGIFSLDLSKSLNIVVSTEYLDDLKRIEDKYLHINNMVIESN